MEAIAATVLDNIQEHCQCGFIRDQITDEVFRCFLSSPQAVTYRAVLHGTANATSSQLISQIEQWIAEGAAITIQRILLSVDGSCAVAIPSFVYNEECSNQDSTVTQTLTTLSQPSATSRQADSNLGAIIGGGTVVVVVIVTVVAIVVVVIAVLVLKNRHSDIVNKNLQPR